LILVTSDTHCYYDTINQQIEYAETVLNRALSCVIHLGDFGIYKANLHEYFIRKGKRFIRPVYFIEGNHEDFQAFPRLTEKYRDFFTHLPRGTVQTLDGYRFLALGGAAYMDSYNTQKGAIITDANINQCLSIPRDAVDIILTHDCPNGIGVPNTPGLDYYGATGFPRSDELGAHFKPRLWLFGHHHKLFEYGDACTQYYGLGDTWKGFGLLDADYQFRIVMHQIAWERPPLIERLLIKLKIIRPDRPPVSIE
jgi:predicted phosphodiesterase